MDIKSFVKITFYKILSAFNLPFYYLFGKRKNTIMLQSLKDSHLNEKCFIVCSGPSLKTEDLDRLAENNIFSFAMNNIGKIYPKTKWRADVLMMREKGVFRKRHGKVALKCEAGLKILNSTDYLRGKQVIGNKVYIKSDCSPKLLKAPKFSGDALDILYSIGTSTYITIEFAYFMGFREMYLIGCDMSYAVNINKDGSIFYNSSGVSHCYDTCENKKTNKTPNPTWQQIVALDFVEQYSKKHGFRIYNATRGGCLESFERVDIDCLLSKISN